MNDIKLNNIVDLVTNWHMRVFNFSQTNQKVEILVCTPHLTMLGEKCYSKHDLYVKAHSD